jgi:hypothetical protein
LTEGYIRLLELYFILDYYNLFKKG